MNRHPTHYEVLGVRPTATAGEIRAAYVRLIKQHHPDSMGPGGELAAGDAAPLINRGYAVLKDPAQRTAYDVQLRRGTARQIGPRAMRRTHPMRRRGDRRGALAVPALLCAVGVIVIAAQLSPGALPFEWPGLLLASPPPARAVAGPVPALNSQIRREARLATTISLSEAVHSSRQCFAAARARQSPSAAEPCIVFDNAALYWHQTAGDPALPPVYFRDAVVWRRHTDALADFGAAAQDRLGALREIAFAALLQELRLATSRPVGPAPKVGAAPTDSAAPTDAAVMAKATRPSGPPSGKSPLLPDGYAIVPNQDN